MNERRERFESELSELLDTADYIDDLNSDILPRDLDPDDDPAGHRRDLGGHRRDLDGIDDVKTIAGKTVVQVEDEEMENSQPLIMHLGKQLIVKRTPDNTVCFIDSCQL